LAEALYIADRKARESVEIRAQLQKKQAQKEKEKKEETLRQLAQQVREERAGIRQSGASGSRDDEDAEASERDVLRHERHRERQRERNLARAAPGDKKYVVKFSIMLIRIHFFFLLQFLDPSLIVNANVTLANRSHSECRLVRREVKRCTINAF
jgi:hypothetical protein